MTRGPSRIQLLRKDPIGWQKFADQLFQHSEVGSALTMRGVQGRRPSIFDLEPKLRSLNVPTLIMVGDEDDLCIEPSIFMKRCIPMAGLVMFPQSGHAINLEEPGLFNRVVQHFLTAVEAGKWVTRDT
jgi:pimeloyl-ACP methyl ester carboxylesterase